MLPIIVIGKGPSAIKIKSSSDYKIACCNNAIDFTDKVDYVFFNDVEPISYLKEGDLDKVDNVILPSFLNSKGIVDNFSVDGRCYWEDVINNIFPNIFKNKNILLHELYIGDNSRQNKNDNYPTLSDPDIGTVESCGETAISWILSQTHHRDIIICGIEKSGGYHPDFYKLDSDGNPINSGWGSAPQPSGYDRDYSRIEFRIDKSIASFRRLDEMGDVF